jgi:ABC-type amino acid transport substrate-binding protein
MFPRRRARVATGALVVALAVAGNVLIYSSINDSTEVLQVVRDVPAGDLITADDLRVVEVDADSSVPTVSPDRIGEVVNRYARVHIAAGSLMVDVLAQPQPLVAIGQGVVAVEIRPTRIPAGLRERSRVLLVGVGQSDEADVIVEGRVVSRGTGDGTSGELVGLSVEVAEEYAAALAAADDVRVALIDPASDPAFEGFES